MAMTSAPSVVVVTEVSTEVVVQENMTAPVMVELGDVAESTVNPSKIISGIKGRFWYKKSVLRWHMVSG